MNGTHTAPPEIDRLRGRALLVGLVALAAVAVGTFALGGLERTYFSYLIAFVFWIGIALGSLAMAMLHQLSGGGWGVVIRRMLESATRTLPVMALLFLPLVFGIESLYEWAREDAVEHSHVLQHKQPYLNVPFFLARAAAYFAIWILLAFLLNRWSAEQDRTGEPRIYTRLRTLSGPGLALYALTVTFASVDWVMSLDPEWFSTIFGVLTVGGQGLSALAFVVAVLVLLSNHEPLSRVVRPSHLHDLGKLMLAFVMLWAYFAFSQFLIIWAGNLPEEIPWYLRRMQGNWKWFGLALIVLHFALPFALLLSQDLKRRGRRLATVALLIVIMRAIDTIWLIAPEFHETERFSSRLGLLLDGLALVGLGGVWIWLFLTGLKSRPMLPLNDPNQEVLEAEH